MPEKMDFSTPVRRKTSYYPADEFAKAKKQSLTTNFVFLPTVDHIFQNGAICPGKAILDIGCGFGICVQKFMDWGASGYTGFDLSEEQVDACKRHHYGPNLNFFVASADDFEVDGTFDIAVSFYVLHYMANVNILREVFRRVYRHLNDGGMFVAVIPTWEEGEAQPKEEGPKLGVLFEVEGPLEDEAKMKNVFYHNGEVVSVIYTSFYFRKTYERALRDAGFSSVEWVQQDLKDGASSGAQVFEGYLRTSWFFVARK